MFWGRRFLSGLLVASWWGPNPSEKKCHSRMETMSTAFSKFEMCAFIGGFDIWRTATPFFPLKIGTYTKEFTVPMTWSTIPGVPQRPGMGIIDS
jgi:hypothetical protein